MDEGIVFLAVVVPLMTLGGGVLVILMAMYQRTKTLEMKHRERMAMIEHGLAPGPEKNPAAFESWQHRQEHPPARSTSVGVVAVALGVGLMLMIGFAGESPGPAIGVGGAVVVLGIAFIVNGELQRRSLPPVSGPSGRTVSIPPPPLGPSDPPGPVGP